MADGWNISENILNEKLEDECATEEIPKLSVYQKGEENLVFDMSFNSCKRIRYNSLKKSIMFHEKAHKMELKAFEFEQIEGSKLMLDEWEKIILHHSRRREALRVKYDDKYKLTLRTEWKLTKLFRRMSKRIYQMEKMKEKKRDKKEKYIAIRSFSNAILEKMPTEDYLWSDELLEEYEHHIKLLVKLGECIRLLKWEICYWNFEIKEMKRPIMRRKRVVKKSERRRLRALENINYHSKEIAKLKQKIKMVLSSDARLRKVKRLRNKASGYDYLAKLFQKQYISKMSNLDDNQTDEQFSLHRHLAWTKKDICSTIQNYKKADQKTFSNQSHKLKGMTYDCKMKFEKYPATPMVLCIVEPRWITRLQNVREHYKWIKWKWTPLQ